MTFRVQELRRILGPSLAQLWLSDGAQNRAVTCVTCFERIEDAADAQSGEVMVLMRSASVQHAAVEILERPSRQVPAALLLSSGVLSELEQLRVRELALTGQVAVGMLAPEVDPRATV